MQTELSNFDIMALDQRKRASLINSLSGFKSLNLIGSINHQNQCNVALFNSVVHLGANPPLLGFIVRPDHEERHTLENIEETGYYTVNHVTKAIYQNAHQSSAKYPRQLSEFDAVGLEKEFKANCPAPFVKDACIQIALKFVQRIKIEINQTNLVIGEIHSVSFPLSSWTEDGYLDIEKAGTIAGTSLDGYHETTLIERLQYARPDQPLVNFKMRHLG